MPNVTGLLVEWHALMRKLDLVTASNGATTQGLSSISTTLIVKIGGFLLPPLPPPPLCLVEVDDVAAVALVSGLM